MKWIQKNNFFIKKIKFSCCKPANTIPAIKTQIKEERGMIWILKKGKT